ncbi:hypothetical protein [uncultured Sunxiuqinia sp.]|uniref:hypothetical protein n=1 Tax=uncultured Sunxiuqinia sp. TaxID=1573825 RepID=UPI0026063CC0|nr:hypothetical protein [uncultured Sunxiuqinia sp.]
MKKLSILLLVSLFFAVTSCKEDDFSDAEIVAQELHRVMEENDIHRVVGVGEGQSWSQPTSNNYIGYDFEFYSHFVRIEKVTYNLDKLVKYEVKKVDGFHYLLLSF